MEKAISQPTEVNGLLLAGGASRRMGRDKAQLRIDGASQLERAFALLDAHCARSYVSIGADQRDDPARGAFPRLVDRTAGLGPVGGILTALEFAPRAAWLVLACDLPLLDGATLDFLLGERDRAAAATAFRSANDGLPEPLCAIWEPASRPLVASAVERGLRCPRKILLEAATHLVDLPAPHVLANVNTPEDLAACTRLNVG